MRDQKTFIYRAWPKIIIDPRLELVSDSDPHWAIFTRRMHRLIFPATEKVLVALEPAIQFVSELQTWFRWTIGHHSLQTGCSKDKLPRLHAEATLVEPWKKQRVKVSAASDLINLDLNDTAALSVHDAAIDVLVESLKTNIRSETVALRGARLNSGERTVYDRFDMLFAE